MSKNDDEGGEQVTTGTEVPETESRTAFLNLAAEFDQFYDELGLGITAKEIAEEGSYSVLLQTLSPRVAVVRGAQTAIIEVQMLVLEGPQTPRGQEMVDQSIKDTFFLASGAGKASVGQANLISLGRLVGSLRVRTVQSAVEAIEAACGKVIVQVAVVRSKNKKYWNLRYQSVIVSADDLETPSHG